MLDTLLYNGSVYTMEKEGEKAEAIGFKDGRIAFVGSDAEAVGLESRERVDLSGRTAVPGMADSHMHMYALCQNMALVNLEDASSIADVVNAMREKAEKIPEGTWIKGVNFDQNKFAEQRFPTREDLDSASTRHPMIIRRVCLHAIVANSMALALAGMDKDYVAPGGGVVERYEDGEPTGIVREQCTQAFDLLMPDPLADEKLKKEIVSSVFADMASRGITTIHTYAASIWNYIESDEYYRELERAGELPVRVTVNYDDYFTPETLTAQEEDDPCRLVRTGAYKMFTDGSLGARSAALFEPYADDSGNRGILVSSYEDFAADLLGAYERGMQVAIHAIGDRALDMALCGIEKALAATAAAGMSADEQAKRRPFRIIHAQLVNPALLERMKKLPVVIDVQPRFISTDLHWVEQRVGKERLPGAYIFKSMMDMGFILTGGSDAPVESYDPIRGICSAVTRSDDGGDPVEGFMPEERMSVYEAMCLYTKNVHYATGNADKLGTLTVGKFADMAVLDRDIFALRGADIPSTKVDMTYMAGRLTFKRK